MHGLNDIAQTICLRKDWNVFFSETPALKLLSFLLETKISCKIELLVKGQPKIAKTFLAFPLKF